MKHLFLILFKIYIFFNIHVALAVIALYLIFNSTISINYIYFLFFSTIFAYNLIRLFNFGSNRFFIKKFYVKYKVFYLLFLFISGLMSFYFYYLKLPFSTKIILIPFIIITFLYNYNFTNLPLLKLRNNGILKIISVSLVWSVLTILIPEWKNIEDEKMIVLKFVFVFVYVLMLTLSFDQRDLYIDEKELKTLPQLFKGKIIYFYLIISIVLSILLFYIFKSDQLIVSLAYLLISVYLCFQSDEKKSFFYTAFWIEGFPIWWLIGFYFLNNPIKI